MANDKVMLKEETPWGQFNSPEKRKNVFCRLAFVFGLTFLYAGVALTVIGWMHGSHITDPYPYKVAGYVCLGTSTVVFIVFMVLSCTSHSICLRCDGEDEEPRPIVINVKPVTSIDSTPKQHLRKNQVSPMHWGEQGGITIVELS